jgi:hypothetical protein
MHIKHRVRLRVCIRVSARAVNSVMLLQIAVGRAVALMRRLLLEHRGYECKEPEAGKLTLAFRCAWVGVTVGLTLTLGFGVAELSLSSMSGGFVLRLLGVSILAGGANEDSAEQLSKSVCK